MGKNSKFTFSAIYNLEKGGFRTTVSDAVWAAYRCSTMLIRLSAMIGVAGGLSSWAEWTQMLGQEETTLYQL
eukprot:767328-Hanusia_phi.AAC.2